MSEGKRIADLRVSKMTIFFVRCVYPLVILWALRERRRNRVVLPVAAEDDAGPVLVGSPMECEVCVRNARRYTRLGRTCASTLAVGGGGGVAVAFLVTAPSLRADQWLGILLLLQILFLGLWSCVWITGRTLQMDGFVVTILAPSAVLTELLQIAYSIAAFPNHAVAANSSIWWWLIADGAGWAAIAVLVRELFFQELLEEFPPPRTWGPGARESHAVGHSG